MIYEQMVWLESNFIKAGVYSLFKIKNFILEMGPYSVCVFMSISVHDMTYQWHGDNWVEKKEIGLNMNILRNGEEVNPIRRWYEYFEANEI